MKKTSGARASPNSSAPNSQSLRRNNTKKWKADLNEASRLEDTLHALEPRVLLDGALAATFTDTFIQESIEAFGFHGNNAATHDNSLDDDNNLQLLSANWEATGKLK